MHWTHWGQNNHKNTQRVSSSLLITKAWKRAQTHKKNPLYQARNIWTLLANSCSYRGVVTAASQHRCSWKDFGGDKKGCGTTGAPEAEGCCHCPVLFGFQNSQYSFCPVFKIYEPNPAETAFVKKNHPKLWLFIDLFVFPLGLWACWVLLNQGFP